jgi:hypothetical protein
MLAGLVSTELIDLPFSITSRGMQSLSITSRAVPVRLIFKALKIAQLLQGLDGAELVWRVGALPPATERDK